MLPIGDTGSPAVRDAATLDVAVVRRRWEDVLRSFAESLDQHRSLLLSVQPDGFEAGTDGVPFAFVAPIDLPPCPPDLASRLHALAHETAGLVELARTTLAELKPTTVPHAHRAPGVRESASTMDTRL